jgi:hypothetical protein
MAGNVQPSIALSRIPDSMSPRFNLVRSNPRNQHGYCIAAMILLSKLPTMAQGLRHGLKAA